MVTIPDLSSEVALPGLKNPDSTGQPRDRGLTLSRDNRETTTPSPTPTVSLPDFCPRRATPSPSRVPAARAPAAPARSGGARGTCPPLAPRETAPTPTRRKQAVEAQAAGKGPPSAAGRPTPGRGGVTWRTTSLGSCAARNSSSTRPLADTFLVLSMSQ